MSPKIAHYDHKPNILEISGGNVVYLIDLDILYESDILNEMMIRIFKSKISVIIGFNFAQKVAVFAHELPHLNFILYASRFIDIHTQC